MRQIPGWPSRWFPTWTANTRSTGPATPSSSSACRRNVLRCRECRCITPDSGPDTAACGRMAEASRAAATMGRAPGAHSNFTVMVQAPMRFGSRTLHGAVSPIRTILRWRSSMMRASPVPFLWVLLAWDGTHGSPGREAWRTCELASGPSTTSTLQRWGTPVGWEPMPTALPWRRHPSVLSRLHWITYTHPGRTW